MNKIIHWVLIAPIVIVVCVLIGAGIFGLFAAIYEAPLLIGSILVFCVWFTISVLYLLGKGLEDAQRD